MNFLGKEIGAGIKGIVVSDGWGYQLFGNKNPNHKCHLEISYHGGYDTPWGIETVDGIEIRRWNLVTAQMVEWEG